MKTSVKVAIVAACAASATGAIAAPAANDTVFIPERAVVLTGDKSKVDGDVMAVFYSRENLAFNDPNAPRFLLLDREGKMAFGVGGSVYATASYGFNGAIDGTGFTTYDISVPANPALRQRFGADLSHSSLFIRMVGKSSRWGYYQVYVQSNFTGNDGNYGFKLKQAYVSVGNLTAGLAHSTFSDPASQAPTIDTEGPSGQIDDKNILFRYTTPIRNGFKGAISIEHPTASYTTGTRAEAIAQRVPDIPAYIQYGWGGDSHVRLSAIFRDLAYRDLVTGKNKLQPAWGLQFSTIANLDPTGIVQFFGHIAYGKGIGQYLNDVSGSGYDLVETTTAGELEAPRMMGWTAGLYLNITKKFFLTSCFSRSQVYACHQLGGNSYRYGQYIVANAFYDVDDNFRLGAEYLHGTRKNYDGEHGKANRFNLLLQYSF